MIFFLSPVDTVDRDTDFNNTNNNIPLDYCTATSTVYTVQYVHGDNNIIVHNITISDVATMTTTIYKSHDDTTADNVSSATVTMTTHVSSTPSAQLVYYYIDVKSTAM